jgi:hypothetical protein
MATASDVAGFCWRGTKAHCAEGGGFVSHIRRVNHKDTKDTKVGLGSFGKFPSNDEFTSLSLFLPITPSPFPSAEIMGSFRNSSIREKAVWLPSARCPMGSSRKIHA